MRSKVAAGQAGPGRGGHCSLASPGWAMGGPGPLLAPDDCKKLWKGSGGSGRRSGVRNWWGADGAPEKKRLETD